MNILKNVVVSIEWLIMLLLVLALMVMEFVTLVIKSAVSIVMYVVKFALGFFIWLVQYVTGFLITGKFKCADTRVDKIINDLFDGKDKNIKLF